MKKNLDATAWIGILACIGILGISMQYNAKQTRERAKAMEGARAKAEEVQAESGAEPNSLPETTNTAEQPANDTGSDPAQVVGETSETTLETDRFRLTLTNRGAGIRIAELLNHKRKLDSEGEYVTINETRDFPIGAISPEPNVIDGSIWTVKEQSETSVTYTTSTSDKLAIEKTFRIPEHGRPYEVEMIFSVRNDSGATIDLSQSSARYLYAGGAAPLHFNEWSMQIGLFLREDQSTFYTKTVDYFGGKPKVLGVFGASDKPYAILPGRQKIADNLAYSGVNNQFYATLVHAREPADGQIWASKYPVVIDNDPERSKAKHERGLELGMSLPAINMGPGDQKTLTYDFYIGPKESSILADAGQGRKAIMNYDQIPIFGKILGWAISPLAQFLSWGMVTIKGFVGNYGVAIIILTILIRLLMWPVYAKSARSMKRMSKLAPMMKEIKEKYPDDPSKVNQETMKLYKEYQINPMGGCLPMFLQLPVFLGFYRMLWGAVELRHESFMGFVSDLTMPDELFMIPGINIPFNLLPVLMAAASFVQMAMTPKTGDNTQRMIFMMMPIMFLVFCYNFASGLALYWTISNVFTVFQTWIMNKLPEPELKKSDKPKSNKKGFMEKLQDKLEEAQEIAEAQKQGKPIPTKKKAAPKKGSDSATSSGKKKNSKNKSNQPPTPQPGQSRTKLSSERGSRHTKSKKKRR